MRLLLLLTLLLGSIGLVIAQAAEPEFRSLFNGMDLTGWDGNPELWSVQDGCITGTTTGPEQLQYNQFLIWRDGIVKNFELRAKVKQSGNNSGIQYRSKELADVGKWSVGGYQCDIHPTAANNAMMYGEKAGGILAQNGQSVIIDPDGKKWIVSEHEPVKVDVDQWHEYTVIAQGNHLVHKVDGQVTMELRDFDSTERGSEGLLAFQIHRGPAMNVQIKDVMFRELPAVDVPAFDDKTVPPDAKLVEGAKPKDKSPVKSKVKDKAKSKAS